MVSHDCRDALALVLERLPRDASARFGRTDVSLEVIERQERPFSHLVRVAVRSADGEKTLSRLYVKVFKPKDLPGGSKTLRDRIANDFETTQRVHRALSSYAELGTVPPVACYPDLYAIVTEEVNGPTLMEYLRQNAAWFPSAVAVRGLCETMERIGRWLRVFQSTGPEGGAVLVADLSAYVAHRLDTLVRRGALSSRERVEILRQIAGLGGDIDPTALRQVSVHSDFALGNVLVADARIVVLDFAMAKFGSRLHDITRLSVQLDLLTLKPQFRRLVIARLQRALLRGFDPTLSPDDPLFRLLSLLHRVNHLTTLVLHRPSGAEALYNGLIRRRHRRWIARELAAWRPVLEPV